MGRTADAWSSPTKDNSAAVWFSFACVALWVLLLLLLLQGRAIGMYKLFWCVGTDGAPGVLLLENGAAVDPAGVVVS